MREALLTLDGGAKLVFPLVRPSVGADNNLFLWRVYEPMTHAGTHRQFEIMILKGSEKTCQKVKLRLKVSTLGVPFWSHFGGHFFATYFKNSYKIEYWWFKIKESGNEEISIWRFSEKYRKSWKLFFHFQKYFVVVFDVAR